MPQTTINCPRCRQPIAANVEQLFDVSHDPGAKQRLLGGIANHVRCPYCGYEGLLATPIVYHDADKELLLTHFPAELNLPVQEQEKLMGPLINQVLNHLPPEKRKAYLFKPQSHLTHQSLIERILSADGITPEMIKAQQERLNLIDRLLQVASVDARSEMIKQNTTLLDGEFFALFSRLLQASITSGQEGLAQQMTAVQEQLLKESELGRQIKAAVSEMEAAAKSLQEAGKELTRDKLLELIIAAPNEERLKALVSLARGGIDYIFFQTLSERIDKTRDDEKKKLEVLREQLLDFTNEIDRQIEERYKVAQAFLEELLKQPDIRKTTQENLARFNDVTVSLLNTMLRNATDKKDAKLLQKLQQITEVLKEASAPPPEMALIEKLLAATDEASIDKLLQENEALVNDDFMQALSGFVAQMDTQAQAKDISPEDKTIMERLRTVYRVALKFSMRKKMR